MSHSKHVARMIILVVLALAVFHIVRTLFTPVSFGRYGHYRADNVAEQINRPVVHGGAGSCQTCHGERNEQVRSGAHIRVECETCHAPLAFHVKDGVKTGDMVQNRSAALCLRCHEKLEGKPPSFPQIQSTEHLSKMGAAAGIDVCLNCHNAHDPKIGR